MDPFTSCINSVISKCYGASANGSNESLLGSGGGVTGLRLEDFDSVAVRYEPNQQRKELVSAQLLKDAGNELFLKGELQKARDEYEKGLRVFERNGLSTTPVNADETEMLGKQSSSEEGVELLSSLLANRAAVNLRLFQYQQCLYDANLAIKFKPNYEKAWARRGESLYGLRFFDLAFEAYQQAASLVNDPYLYNRMIKCKVHIEQESQGLEVHQLLPGRDICVNPSMLFAPIRTTIWDRVAIPLRNLIYLVVNKDTREAVVIDGAWDVSGICEYAKKHKITIVAALITHWHSDHIGGIPQAPFDKYPVRVEGIAKLVKDLKINGYCHHLDLEEILKANPEMDASKIIPTDTGYELTLPLHPDSPSPEWQSDKTMKETKIKVLHTPGHTRGSACFLVNGNRLFSGDTLFSGSCGRLDFHDSCASSMFNSLQVTLSSLDDECIVFPGHLYGGDYTTIGTERIRGMLRKMDKELFMSRL